MTKTQIQLEEWQYESLKRLSARDARSMSALVREAVSQLLGRLEAHPVLRLEEIAGKYTGRELGNLKDHDQGWTESIR